MHNSNAPKKNLKAVSELFTQFADNQLASIKLAFITQSTASMILACSYFAGALRYFYENQTVSPDEYFSTLEALLMDRFKMNSVNASGLIESNERLFNKYQYIENIYNYGWSTAKAWLNDEGNETDNLFDLHERYKRLSMSDLGIEGIKEKTESIFGVETLVVPAVKKDQVKSSRVKIIILWLLLIVAFIVADIFLIMYLQ
ncbi:MAG: hypothetical protein ACE5EH_06870 [Gammaproteobacteria bacterium]